MAHAVVSALHHMQHYMDSFHIWNKCQSRIFKVIKPWLWNKTAKIWLILPCLLYNIYRYGLIISLFGITDH